MSPCLTVTTGLLTPPSSYNLDARINSAASSLASLGPTTPINGRNPFSEHGYAPFAAIDECHDESMDTLPMDYSFKAPASEQTSFDSWSALGGLPLRMQESFPQHHSLLQAPMTLYSGVDTSVSSLASSAASSFVSIPYSDFQNHMNDYSDLNNGASTQPMWPTELTMAPSEFLLGSEYVRIHPSDPKAEMSGYDDTDVPFALSAPHVMVKREDPGISEDERRIKRSIRVSSTGGKTIKMEQDVPRQKKKTKNSKDHIQTWERSGIHIELKNLNNVEHIPGTKRCRRVGGSTSQTKSICKYKVDNHACGRVFRRQEHLIRHVKTHSGRKDHGCAICGTRFNRNDNCWEHYWTHVRRPGKKEGRNAKMSLCRVLTFITHQKHTDKLLNKWRKKVGWDYCPERDPFIEMDPPKESDDEDMSPAAIKEEGDCGSPSANVKKTKVIRCKG